MKIRLEDSGTVELSDWTLYFDFSGKQGYTIMVCGLTEKNLCELKKLIDTELK